MSVRLDDINDGLIAYFDGLCEPRNPGGWACGGFVTEPHGPSGVALKGHQCFYHGPEATNNVAEYRAALLALETLWKAGYRGRILLRGDSQLVVRQFEGRYACNVPALQSLLARLRKAGECFESLKLEWVPREANSLADEQSRLAYREATGKEPPVRVKNRV